MVGVLAGWNVLVGVLVAVGSLGYLHVTEHQLSVFKAAVSEYGISRHRGGYRSMTVALGYSGLSAAIGIAAFPAGHEFTAVVLLLLVFGLTRACISWVPMDVPGGQRTFRGAMHTLLAIAAFASAAAASWISGTTIGARPGHQALGLALLIPGVLMTMTAVMLLAARRIPRLRRLFGLNERVLYLGMVWWLAALGTVLTTGWWR